jgi:signal transduction histidine kinase
MKKARKNRLIKKLLLFALPLLIFSISVTAAVLAWNNHGYFLSTIDRDYRNLVTGSANEIELYMENGREDLQGLARILTAAKLDRWRQEMAIKAFNQRGLSFLSIGLLSRGAEMIAASGWMGADPVAGSGPLFEKVLGGQSIFSDILLNQENVPYVHLGVPVFQLGEVSAVLWGQLSLKAIWDVIERIRIGQTGQVYIMDLSGKVIVDRNIVPVLKSPPRTAPEILERLAGLNKTPFAWAEERDHVKYYCLGSAIPSLGWVIVLRQTDEETYAYLYRNIRWAAIITLCVCLLTVLLGGYFVRQFLRPINQLHQQVQRIGRGDLDHKVDVQSEDEIGDLSVEFNKMTDSLRRFIRREVDNAKELVHARNLALLGTASTKVTHEVGNLLSNMALSIMMLRREQLSASGERSIVILVKESARVKTFIQNFLQFAKKPELTLQRISVGEVAKEILALVGPRAEAGSVALSLDWPPDLPLVSADGRLVYQVLNNLIKNSLEAMTGQGEINIGGAVEDGWLR